MNTYADVRNRSHYLDSFYDVKKCKLKSGVPFLSFFKKAFIKAFLKKMLFIVLTHLGNWIFLTLLNVLILLEDSNL